jgi:hypothetical protein
MTTTRLRLSCLAAFALAMFAATRAAFSAPVVVQGVVRRADSRAPVAGATVAIKLHALAGEPELGSAVTGDDGAFRLIVVLDGKDFVCEARAPGMFTQVVGRNVRTRVCNFELESELTVTEVSPRSPVVGRGPGLAFFANTGSELLLRTLRVRLHLAKPLSCGSQGETQQYHLAGEVQVGFGTLQGTITDGPTAFVMTGEAPLQACAESELSLEVQPARRLAPGNTPIVITLPAQLALRRDRLQRTMSLIGAGFSPTYRSTIDRITIELVTSRGAMASAQLPGLAIPVGVAR